MLDSFDYKEPKCAVCDGKEFYYPGDKPLGERIPIDRIIKKVDECFNKNNHVEAGRLLEFWLNEAKTLFDTAGELSILSELVGFYRKVNDKNKGLSAIKRAIELVGELKQSDMVSGATIYLNCATAFKAFDEPNKALALYEKAKGVYLKLLSKDDARLGGLYNNMALTLVDLTRYDQAEFLYKNSIDVMKSVKNGQADLAITYVNMAHLYEKMNNPNSITDCMYSAYSLLASEDIDKNGYFARVCDKCAPSFEYFGYKLIADELKKVSGEIYERARSF